MKELSQQEVDLVSGADLKGFFHGMALGGAAGMSLGGIWGGAGGWGFGALAQLGGIISGGIVGALAGSTVGLLHDSKTVTEITLGILDRLGRK
ncbi:hypothetical protein [Pseudomonas chlororaphis]|uniref:DUF5862 family protein n=1 Tax=Pseudomonas chlororaphis TaxID=587753 RepID=UPI000F57B7C2|nr:hypothetical protein [Pseudomonas chlororaphis]